MRYLLLTGAGFSRNWGGWLASEAFEYLLGCAELTPALRERLWDGKIQGLGFEDILAELRAISSETKSDQHLEELRLFETMLLSMFYTMRIGFENTEFEPGQEAARLGPQPTPVRDFLCRFDAIFTLNQDTLLEQKYAPSNLQQGSQGRWFGLHCPGISDILIGGQKVAPPGLFIPSPAPFTVPDRRQPYYKLHGSSNWRASDNSALLILGGNKRADVNNVPLLTWYQSEFLRLSRQAAVRIMIIGYSFRDGHINEMLGAAASDGAKFFVIDANGVDTLAAAATGPALPSQLREAIQNNIIGASRRHLKEVLYSDTVERTKITKFLAPD